MAELKASSPWYPDFLRGGPAPEPAPAPVPPLRRTPPPPSKTGSAPAPTPAPAPAAELPTLNPREIALAGLLAGAFTAFVTMPLDVINTQMKAPTATRAEQHSMLAAARTIVRNGRVQALWRGSIPRMTIFGLGSSVFWTLFDSVQKLVDRPG